jgi:hypothetical protein
MFKHRNGLSAACVGFSSGKRRENQYFTNQPDSSMFYAHHIDSYVISTVQVRSRQAQELLPSSIP